MVFLGFGTSFQRWFSLSEPKMALSFPKLIGFCYPGHSLLIFFTLTEANTSGARLGLQTPVKTSDQDFRSRWPERKQMGKLPIPANGISFSFTTPAFLQNKLCIPSPVNIFLLKSQTKGKIQYCPLLPLFPSELDCFPRLLSQWIAEGRKSKYHKEPPSPAHSPTPRCHNCVLSSTFLGLSFLNENSVTQTPSINPCSDAH